MTHVESFDIGVMLPSIAIHEAPLCIFNNINRAERSFNKRLNPVYPLSGSIYLIRYLNVLLLHLLKRNMFLLY